MTRDELLQRLSDADIAFAEVNTMADLAGHPHLRRIEVNTPRGPVNYPAPAAIVIDQPRHYGPVPGIGERFGIANASSSARTKSS
jgi:itaconate CoA-transferase